MWKANLSDGPGGTPAHAVGQPLTFVRTDTMGATGAYTRYSAGMTLTRLVLLVMAVMIVLIVARTVFGSRR